MKEIVLEIDETGEQIKIEGHGMVGPECTQLTAVLEEALGDVTKRELKPEYRTAKAQGRVVSR